LLCPTVGRFGGGTGLPNTPSQSDASSLDHSLVHTTLHNKDVYCMYVCPHLIFTCHLSAYTSCHIYPLTQRLCICFLFCFSVTMWTFLLVCFKSLPEKLSLLNVCFFVFQYHKLCLTCAHWRIAAEHMYMHVHHNRVLLKLQVYGNTKN
jgi:hypothetical protein